MTAQLDPIAIARFFSLPGAVELVEAFSSIPPGPVRDSIVVHAQTLAQNMGWAMGQPPPNGAHGVIAWVDKAPVAAPALKAISSDGQIVERALRGEAPADIAASLRIDIEVVFRLMERARKEGGVAFPGDETGRNHSKASKLMKSIRGRPTAPKPPYWWEDPQSPVWDNPGLLPGVLNAKGSMAAIGPMSAQAHKAMSFAAARRGVTLRQQVAERAQIVARVKAGERPVAVADDMRWQAFNVYGLLAQVGFSATQAAGEFDRPIVNTGRRGPSRKTKPK